jgi:hypothetical protein
MLFNDSELRPIILIITAASLFILLIFTLALREDIGYTIKRFLPVKKSHRRAPIHKPFAIWAIFWSLALTSAMGLFFLVTTYEPAVGNQNVFIVTPTPITTPTPTPDPVDESPVYINLRFPSGMNPCSIEEMVIIPEEVDPYELPLVYSIDRWFNRGQFLTSAYAELRVSSVDEMDDILLTNKVLARVVDHNPHPGPVAAAFTLCDQETPRPFPVIELSPDVTQAVLILDREETTRLYPDIFHGLEVKLIGKEPGLYEVNLGVEYIMDGETHQAWFDQPIIVQVPERIQRWSAGVVTYWGDCDFENGEYICEEVELQEPVLIAAEPEPTTEVEPGAPTPTPDFVCSPAPPQRLEPGMEAQVSFRLGLRLRIREEPGLNGRVITSMSRGTHLTVLDGPVCQDGYKWWHVDIRDSGLVGWMAEGEPRLYYLDPID